MIKAFSAPLQEDLTEFTQFLWQNEIPHRVLEFDDRQELWVARSISSEQICRLFELWRRGEDLSQLNISVNHNQGQNDFFTTAKRAWFSTALIFFSAMLSFLIGFGENIDLLRHFTFTEIFLQGDNLYTRALLHNVESFQLWRFISPIFLHFSAPHIIFNALWIWIVGTRMEIMQGRLPLLLLVLFAGVASNFAQYWVSGPMFGGLSGIVFALLGYAWLWDKLNSANRFGLPPALMGFMLFWLVLGYTGVLEGIGFGAIANTAHLVGLIAGLIFVPVGRLFIKR
ncbi:rhomboid family intramembrane serine protease [Neptuniibacter sp.]|uniref:rhomboid family intramembrane serine protease n=1 Tax=Neptuniibacter sp. TaxID=1962643 RepID=UPI0026061E15|nr:rhomboid family intramembrane serine protease [Neptuniibacter sp.]MCP4596351.1 rhomboid family intramembrane serine protease [Neptuniibacter sp.]